MKRMAMILILFSLLFSITLSSGAGKREGAKGVPLKEAIEELHRELRSKGKEEFIPLLTEKTVKQAISRAIDGYGKVAPEKAKDENHPWKKTYESMYRNIVKTGIIPGNASFDVIMKMTDTFEDGGQITYEGLWIRLELKSDESIYGFSLPILDAAFGRFAK